jgi:hypothetical protein
MYFIYLDGMITDDARYTRKIKSKIVMEKAVFSRKETFFHQKIGLKFKDESVEVLYFGRSSLWC